MESLGKVLSTLVPTHKYKIIKFSSSVSRASNSFVYATASNIAASKKSMASWWASFRGNGHNEDVGRPEIG